ncbi:hypothetical protein Peur_072171 [Populus x canadensis]
MNLPPYGRRNFDTSFLESPSQKTIYLLPPKVEMRIPQSIVAAITQDIFIKSYQINYGMDQPTAVKVCIIYPDTILNR